MSNPDIISLYSQEQQGGELPYFVGKQYGSGWLKTLARLAFPILKRFGVAAYGAAKDVVLNNKSILPTIKEHALDAVNKVIPGVINKFNENNSEKRSHSRDKRTINKRRNVHTIFS